MLRYVMLRHVHVVTTACLQDAVEDRVTVVLQSGEAVTHPENTAHNSGLFADVRNFRAISFISLLNPLPAVGTTRPPEDQHRQN